MLDNCTIEKMHQLKLQGMLTAYQQISQSEQINALTLAEGLSLLLDHEVTYRGDKKLERLLKVAKLRYPQALIEDINYEHKRAMTHEQWQWLIGGQWLLNHQNIILLGPTGIGKTYLACACAQLACRKGYHTRYFRLSKLFNAIRMAHADGSYSRLLAALLKASCLVIDDFGMDSIEPQLRTDLLEIIDDRYDQRSLVIGTQLPIEHWHDYIGDHTIADALLDRIIHQAKIFTLSGESIRKNIDSK